MTDINMFDNFEKRTKDRQVGGRHYKGYAIQPYDFITDNNLNYFQGVTIKYIIRYQEKGGEEDLEKVKHYCDLEIARLRKNKRIVDKRKMRKV
jgi:hypothetical protein